MPRLAALVVSCTFVSGLAGAAPVGPTPSAFGRRFLRHYPTELVPYRAKRHADHGLTDAVSEAGRRARGFYIFAPYLHRQGAGRVARQMRAAQLNAVVINAKDDWGSVLWPSKVPLSRKVQWPLLRDPRGVTSTFHRHGIYVIARIVAFKDGRLPFQRPDLAVRSERDARRLYRGRGAAWLDAYSAEVQDYLIDLAVELESLGVDEIQLDYIRFPKNPRGPGGRWLHQDRRDRDRLVADFLERLDRALRIPISVAIFGLATLVDGDPRGLGQTIEHMARYAEGLSPMMYANGMHNYFRGGRVSEGVYRVIHCGLWRARARAPGVVLRPYLQAYPNGVERFWGPRFIRRQLEAARRAGADGFLFWNPSMKNDVTYQALRALGRAGIDAIGADRELYRDAQNRPRGAFCVRGGLPRVAPR